MKVKVTKKEKAFEPVTIKVTFESLDELKQMECYLSTCAAVVAQDAITEFPDNNSERPLWQEIRDILDALKE